MQVALVDEKYQGIVAVVKPFSLLCHDKRDRTSWWLFRKMRTATAVQVCFCLQRCPRSTQDTHFRQEHAKSFFACSRTSRTVKHTLRACRTIVYMAFCWIGVRHVSHCNVLGAIDFGLWPRWYAKQASEADVHYVGDRVVAGPANHLNEIEYGRERISVRNVPLLDDWVCGLNSRLSVHCRRQGRRCAFAVKKHQKTGEVCGEGSKRKGLVQYK